MDKKSKILSWIIALAVIGSVGFTFYKTVIQKDFEVIEEATEDEVVEENGAQNVEEFVPIMEDGVILDTETGVSEDTSVFTGEDVLPSKIAP